MREKARKNPVGVGISGGFARILGAVMAGVMGLAMDARTEALQYETVNGIQWSYVIADGKAKVTNWNMSPAINSSTTGAITVPDTLGGCTVTVIGTYAFYQMTGITSLSIPEGVEEIEYYACRGCTRLASVSLPSTLKTIGDGVFTGCQSLKTGTIPDSVTSMGRDTFSGCQAMTSVRFSANVASLGAMTCYNCDSLTNAVIPEGVTDIGVSAFLDCNNLRSIGIPGSVTNIGDYAFKDCVSLESLDLPSRLIALNDSFGGCTSLASVIVPADVGTIDALTFKGCSAMTNIEVDPANSSYQSIDGILYDITGTELVAWPFGRVPVAIPEGVRKIGDSAFTTRRDISSIALPEGLETIGASAFDMCINLATVDFPSTLKAVGTRAFFGCSRLSSATFGEGFQTVDERAFSNTGIQSLVFPESTTLIAQYAFGGCRQLRSLEVKSRICGIEDFAFEDCPNLASVSIAAGADVSPYAFGHPPTPPSIDAQNVLWACDFNEGTVGRNVQSDYYADGHVVLVGNQTSTRIVSDDTSQRTNALINAFGGDGVWFSANRVYRNQVGDYVVPDRGQTITLSFLLSSVALCTRDDMPGMVFPGVADGTTTTQPDYHFGHSGTMVSLDDKVLLWCSENHDNKQGYVWQVTAGVRDGSGTIVERTISLASSDNSQVISSFTNGWGEIRIEAVNDGSAEGLAFHIYFDETLAMSADTGETTFRAKPSATDRTGVSSAGFGGTVSLDDIVFRLDEGDPLADIDVLCDGGTLTVDERKTLADIVGQDTLHGITEIRLLPAKGEEDDSPLTCIRLGLSPASMTTSKSKVELRFKNPTAEITGFNLADHVVTGRIVPAEGTRVLQPPMRYMFGLNRIANFGTDSQHVEEYGESVYRNENGFALNLSNYVRLNGVFSLVFPAVLVEGDSAFFSISIKSYADKTESADE